MMPAFFDVGRADEQETESRQPSDGVMATVVSAESDGRGWRFSGPIIAFWRRLRGTN